MNEKDFQSSLARRQFLARIGAGTGVLGAAAAVPSTAWAQAASTTASATVSSAPCARRFNQGLGYAPGWQYETSEEKRSIQTPGLTVQVPLR